MLWQQLWPLRGVGVRPPAAVGMARPPCRAGIQVGFLVASVAVATMLEPFQQANTSEDIRPRATVWSVTADDQWPRPYSLVRRSPTATLRDAIAGMSASRAGQIVRFIATHTTGTARRPGAAHRSESGHSQVSIVPTTQGARRGRPLFLRSILCRTKCLASGRSGKSPSTPP
jgi:hypothetical protein